MGYTDLENLNLKHNFPAVDLGTKSGDCAIQVTVTSSSTKIVETQEKFFEHGIMNTYAKLIFVILGRNRPATTASGSFDPKANSNSIPKGTSTISMTCTTLSPKAETRQRSSSSLIGSSRSFRTRYDHSWPA